MPPRARGLRAGAVRLGPGGVVAWHTTGRREELLVSLEGCVTLEVRARGLRRARMRAGQSMWLPPGTRHRVVNDGRRLARYIYVTGAR